MQIKSKNSSKNLLICVAIIVIAITAYTSVLMWNFSEISKNGRTVPIISLGKHATPNSDWVESIDVLVEDEKLVLTIHDREKQFNSQGKFIRWGKPKWNLFHQSGYVKSSYTSRFPIVDQWEVTINDKLKTVTYETESYRWWYDHSDPFGSITYGKRKDKSKSENN